MYNGCCRVDIKSGIGCALSVAYLPLSAIGLLLRKLFAMRIIILLTAVTSFGGVESQDGDNAPNAEVAPRTSFKLQLAKINITYNNERKKYNQVKIYLDDTEAHSIIAPDDDALVKKNGETTVYRELPGRTYMLSDFEVKTINQVCQSFVSTLTEFDNIVKNNDWGRALYLDSFFPRFLQGFHVMICAAKDSPDALPRGALVTDKDYDVSLTSPKSDARIKMWQTDKDRLIKLRLSTQELIIQTQKWQKNELSNSKRNPELSYSGDFDRAFTSFIRNYLGRSP